MKDLIKQILEDEIESTITTKDYSRKSLKYHFI
jgi:hypothetical protein